jgi:hypothetical protein
MRSERETHVNEDLKGQKIGNGSFHIEKIYKIISIKKKVYQFEKLYHDDEWVKIKISV